MRHNHIDNTLMSITYIKAESFIFTLPIYHGVNQHPEFKWIANEFLNRTFIKWDPDSVSGVK
jgi:hypothetical protein